MVSVLAQLALTAIMLSTGSLNTISKKILYQTKGQTIDPDIIQKYQRPWFCTFIMFCGEAMCMLFFYCFALYYHCTDKHKDRDSLPGISEITSTADQPQQGITFVSREEVKSDPTGGLGWKFPLCAALFAGCDLLSTTLTGIGLLYCNASVIQILRGFVIVFTMLFAWVFLKRRPTLHQVIGVLFAIFGLVMVGVSAVMVDKNTPKKEGDEHSVMETVLGIGLTLAAQVFSSIQFVFEEKFLKQNTQKTGPIPSLFLVGSEGIAGAVLTMGVALPIVNAIHGNDFGSYENLRNSIYMMFHTPLITGLQLLYFGSISFFNWSSFVYSKALSATARTLVDACRTIVVWIVMVAVYYSVKSGDYGEPVGLWSILQGVGFIGMMLGTTTHNNIAGFGDMLTACCKKKQVNMEIDDKPLIDSD